MQDDMQDDMQEAEVALTPESVRANLQLPPEFQDSYDRMVLAGMKTMFDPRTHQMAMGTLKGDGPIDERLGRGIAALVGMLVKESNNTLAPQVIIPGGVELLVAAGDFLKKSGAEPITDEQIADAIGDFVSIVLDQLGAGSPEQVQQLLQQAQAAPQQQMGA